MEARPEVWRGFDDPVLGSQSVFRAVMSALARPGTVAELATEALHPPPPMTPELAAIALALCDHETPVWLDRRLATEGSVARFIRFQTGAPLIEAPADAAFAFAVDLDDLPPLAAFAQGTDEYPDRSTTLILAVEALGSGRELALTGPGIKAQATLAIMPFGKELAAAGAATLDKLSAQLADNRARFPRGIDCVFVGGGKIAALPRSTQVTAAAAASADARKS
jgi:alpha-D-ribose 1-methylphosphonate 5-triphosphate synthase subunit PhnH